MDKTEKWTKLKIEQNRTKLEKLFGAILKVQNEFLLDVDVS